MPQRDCKIQPNGDNPSRQPKSYMDKHGTNPMKAAFDNCFIKTRLGRDPITGKPIDVWDEQINREKQILESVGELVKFYRMPITPVSGVNDGVRCPICWDERRGTARSSCTTCNGFGVITDDPDITRVNGYQLLKNPDRSDGLFYTHYSFTPQKMESQDIGLMQQHESRFWTVPIRNCEGNIANILQNRDVMIRYIFDENKNPVQELGRYELLDVSFSLGPDNKLLHMAYQLKQVNPGTDKKVYALPNGL